MASFNNGERNMQLIFDSIEEVKAFVTQLKGTRGKGKGDDGDDGAQTGPASNQAPAPLMPPQQQFNPAPPPATFTPPPVNPFPPQAQTAIDPVIAGLVQRITARIDAAITSGQPADAVLNWFRGQCGAEASAATMDQIKNVFLHKLAAPGLENIAKLMNA
jgi:hypothetical protein